MKFAATSLLLLGLACGLWWALGRGARQPAPEPEPAPAWSPVERRPVGGTLPVPAEDAELGPWIERNNGAVRALEQGDLDRAILELEACLAARPEQEAFRLNLAEACFRRAVREHDRAAGDRAQALADLARAVELDPDHGPRAELLERWRRMAELEADFAGYESPYFSLSYDGDRRDLRDGSQQVIDVLESAYVEFWLLLGHDPVRSSGERIRVVLYEREQFHAATGLGHWAGGAFDGTLRLPVDDLGAEVHAWTRTLRHELAHAFLASQGGRAVPGWLNEGLAQWLEGDREVQLQGARAQVRGGTLFDLDELGGSLSALGDAAAIRRAYSQSLLLVDHLQRQYGERLVGELIDACATGSTPAARFEERLGFPLARVIDDLARELQ